MKVLETIEATQLPGEYVRKNLDTVERLVLRDDETYQWTQLVLQEDAPVGYSHTGRWEIEESNVVLMPDDSIPATFEASLCYVVLNFEGKDALMQAANSQYIDSPQLDRFIYIKADLP